MNPELICQDCEQEWTNEDEWVMDVFRCYDYQDYCLNCCGCDEHKNETWFEWATKDAMLLTLVLDDKWYEAVTKLISYWEPGEVCSVVDAQGVKVDKDGALIA